MWKPSDRRFSAVWIVLVFPALLGCSAHGAAPAAPVDNTQHGTELRYEISISERELYEFIDGELVNTYTVAVGQPEYPTRTGEWGIHQVDWNPDWTPPNSDWAEGRRYKEPGEEGNPMGRVRIMFNPPYTIHGTEALESLGTAASHGSVRISNPDGIEIAKRVMRFGGAERSEQWVEETLADPYTMRSVSLPEPVPILIYE